MLTAQHLVERSLAAYRDRIFVIDQHGEMTYGEIGLRSARLANALLALGSSATRPTTIFLPNDYRFIEIDTACMRAGITRVAISTRLSADECQFIVNHSQSAVLVTNEALLSKLDRDELSELKTILLVDAKAGSEGAVRDYESVVSQGRSELTVSPVRPDHPAYVLYTSGTTGRPKGATHTHASRVAAAINMLSSEVVATNHSTMVHGASLTHGSGSKVLSFMAVGARNLILPRFEPEEFARSVQMHGSTHTFSFGNIMLIARQKPDATNVAGLRTWNSLGRFVKRGEKGIFILAPMVGRRSTKDVATEEPSDDATTEGQRTLYGFRAVYVFDVSQTEGKELPTLTEVNGDVSGYRERLCKFVESQSVELSFSERIAPAKGLSYGGKITLLSGMQPAEEFSTLVHEIAHEMLHRGDRRTLTTKQVRETEAEAVAFVVCQSVGLQNGTSSQDYIQLWHGDASLLRESLEAVQQTAAVILGGIALGIAPEPAALAAAA